MILASPPGAQPMSDPESLPPSSGSIRIGIVGGAGQMGSWLRRFWEAQGCETRFSDRGTALTNAEVVLWAQMTFVAVPLDATPSLLRELAPLATGDRVLVSIASLMHPSAAALSEAPGAAICAHPVFGPTVTRTNGLPVIIAPVRGTAWAHWLALRFRAVGMVVHETTPEEHDARMAMVQALLHSLFVALSGTFADADLPVPVALPWASPTLRLQFGMIARILGQDPELYADLVIGNPASPDGLESLIRNLQRLADFARDGDRAAFIAAFSAARDSFGDDLAELAAEAESALAQRG